MMKFKSIICNYFNLLDSGGEVKNVLPKQDGRGALVEATTSRNKSSNL